MSSSLTGSEVSKHGRDWQRKDNTAAINCPTNHKGLQYRVQWEIDE